MHIPLQEAQHELSRSGRLFKLLFERGSLAVEIYKPEKTDHQQPHNRDEVYIIISGSGRFINGDQEVSFGPHDFLFVPAGQEHRFIDFTDDFSTWVLFYGPVGGEKGQN
jgi:mannose-6-phosphate isomerase-like protein (cupin superfamily)